MDEAKLSGRCVLIPQDRIEYEPHGLFKANTKLSRLAMLLRKYMSYGQRTPNRATWTGPRFRSSSKLDESVRFLVKLKRVASQNFRGKAIHVFGSWQHNEGFISFMN
jgi:hypothetical protein